MSASESTFPLSLLQLSPKEIDVLVIDSPGASYTVSPMASHHHHLFYEGGTYRAIPTLDPVNQTLRRDIESLRGEILELKAMLQEQGSLLNQITASIPETNLEEVNLQIMSDPDAREKILELFQVAESPLFYDEISERLCLPLRQTVEVCNALEAEGLIGENSKRSSAGF